MLLGCDVQRPFEQRPIAVGPNQLREWFSDGDEDVLRTFVTCLVPGPHAGKLGGKRPRAHMENAVFSPAPVIFSFSSLSFTML
jgi:hypothetical protein